MNVCMYIPRWFLKKRAFIGTCVVILFMVIVTKKDNTTTSFPTLLKLQAEIPRSPLIHQVDSARLSRDEYYSQDENHSEDEDHSQDEDHSEEGSYLEHKSQEGNHIEEEDLYREDDNFQDEDHMKDHSHEQDSSYLENLKYGCSVVSRGGNGTSSSLRALVDHFHKFVFCDVPKTGTTSWLEFFKVMMERERMERRTWMKRHGYRYPWYETHSDDRFSPLHSSGFNRLSRGREAHREPYDGLPDPRDNYFTFLVVRHPLERLASAFHNKQSRVKNFIYRNFTKAQRKSKPFTFEDFLQYVASPDENLTRHPDMHWQTYQSLCEPCSLSYNYVAHTETLQRDLKYLLPKMRSGDFLESFPRKNSGHTDSHKYKTMYHNISLPVLRHVLDKYKKDTKMFGYSYKGYVPESYKMDID